MWLVVNVGREAEKRRVEYRGGRGSEKTGRKKEKSWGARKD